MNTCKVGVEHRLLDKNGSIRNGNVLSLMASLHTYVNRKVLARIMSTVKL